MEQQNQLLGVWAGKAQLLDGLRKVFGEVFGQSAGALA
jgi:hypothetical protein